ncbi:hypothetical protein A6R68_17222, partial [Neotoma lepida]
MLGILDGVMIKGKPSQYQVTANDSKNIIISGDQSLSDYVSHAKVK